MNLVGFNVRKNHVSKFLYQILIFCTYCSKCRYVILRFCDKVPASSAGLVNTVMEVLSRILRGISLYALQILVLQAGFCSVVWFTCFVV